MIVTENRSCLLEGLLSQLTCLTRLPESGFLDDVSYDSISLGPGYDRPYQFNPSVREAKTIQLYKHLNLKSCIWTFDAYYDMTELIDVCGGSVTADFQVVAGARSCCFEPGAVVSFRTKPRRCCCRFGIRLSLS